MITWRGGREAVQDAVWFCLGLSDNRSMGGISDMGAVISLVDSS